jgi:uncharacterized protein with ACT and thioredoxin-like domain
MIMNPESKLDQNKPEELERIESAAILLPSGEIFVGETHYIAMTLARQQTGIKFITLEMQGFITTKGRFVSRVQAADIAFNAGQIKEKVSSLRSEHYIYSTEDSPK